MSCRKGTFAAILVTTPDGRYIVVRGRLWRAASPNLSPEEHQKHVHALMAARRAVGASQKAGDADALAKARCDVNAAKIALGERGPPWWADGAPDLNRQMVGNTSYRDWWDALGEDEGG